MSLLGEYIAVTEDTARSFIYGKTSVDDYIMANSDRVMSVDEAWHGIYFTLTGENGKKPSDNILANAVPISGCGVCIGGSAEDNPPVLLSADDVKETAEALKRISDEEFIGKFRFNDMLNINIYPLGGFEDNGEQFREFLHKYFVRLRNFFSDAAAQNKTVIFYLMKG